MFQRPVPRSTVQIVAAALAVLVTSLPLAATSADQSDKHTTVDIKALSLTASIVGDIVLADNEGDVTRLDKSANFAQTVAGKKLRMVYKHDDRNGVTREYSVDGSSQPIDAQGKAWLVQVIPTVLRESGLDASARIKRLRERGGTAAVLVDMEKIQLGHSRAYYIQALAPAGQLAPQEMERLRAIMGGISTAPDRRDAYVALLKHQVMSVPQLSTLLADAATLRSNEKCDTLVAAAAVMPADAGLLRQYRETAKTLSMQQRGRAEKALDHLKA